MEFNALHQFRPGSSRSTSVPQNPTRNAASTIMYPYGNFPVPPQASQQPPSSRPPTQYGSWAVGNTSVGVASSPLQRRNTTAATHADNRAISQAQGMSDFSTRPRPHTLNTSSLRTPNSQQHPHSTAQGEMLPTATMDTSAWNQKAMNDVDFSAYDSEMTDLSHGMLNNDEDTPIIDLRQYTNFDGDDQFNGNLSRRMSESSFSMSSTGPMAEVPSTYDDFASSVAGSERLSFISDSDVWSGLEPPPSTCSPTASPRHSYHDALKNSRSRASPAPYSVRSSPYTMDSTRNKRWSTGMYATPTPQRSMSNMNNRHSFFYGSPLNPHHSIPQYTMNGMNLAPPTQPLLYSQAPQLQSNGATLFSSPDHAFAPEVARQLPSQGLFRLLQSNADRHPGCASHFADLSDPPDLYSSLHEEPCDPPESDMHPSDPDLTPHEQDLRFTGDLYTPRWVRGHGNKREGWCGLCKPGRWLVLKNSAFWYDKSFTHGVSAATGAAFQGPQETRRTEGNLDVWEGLCGSCGEWIALVSSKKKGTTWFRHAYKCHTHPKVKDGPKRRRETNTNVRTSVTSSSGSGSAQPTNSGIGLPFQPPKTSPPLTAFPTLSHHNSSTSTEQMASESDEMHMNVKSEFDSEQQRRETTPLSHEHPHSMHQMAHMHTPYHGMAVNPLSVHMDSAMGGFSSPPPAPHKRGEPINSLEALGGMI